MDGVGSTVPFYPVLFAAYPVLRLYAANVTEVDLTDVIVPLVVVVGLTLLGLGALTLAAARCPARGDHRLGRRPALHAVRAAAEPGRALRRLQSAPAHRGVPGRGRDRGHRGPARACPAGHDHAHAQCHLARPHRDDRGPCLSGADDGRHDGRGRPGRAQPPRRAVRPRRRSTRRATSTTSSSTATARRRRSRPSASTTASSSGGCAITASSSTTMPERTTSARRSRSEPRSG